MTFSHCSAVMFLNDLSIVIPALFTRMSMRPNSLMTFSASWVASSGREISPLNNLPRYPCWVNSLKNASATFSGSTR